MNNPIEITPAHYPDEFKPISPTALSRFARAVQADRLKNERHKLHGYDARITTTNYSNAITITLCGDNHSNQLAIHHIASHPDLIACAHVDLREVQR